MSTISLCIPAYNAAWCLPRLLASAKNQIIPFDEIFVYNDCSTDNTEEVALTYGAKVINGNENKGCSFGKNELAKICKSDWIHFHDADDDILPDFTTLAHKWITKKNCPDVILFNYEYRDSTTNVLLGIRMFDNKSLSLNPVKYSIEEQINPFCGLYKKKKFIQAGGYDCDPNILYNEDSAMHISLAINGLTFGSEGEISIINYYFANSMSQGNLQKCAIARYYVLEKTAKTQGHKYASEIVSQLYSCVALLSVYQTWDYIKKALQLCEKLGQPYACNGSRTFNILTKVHPFMAVFLREKMIRIFKPSLRN